MQLARLFYTGKQTHRVDVLLAVGHGAVQQPGNNSYTASTVPTHSIRALATHVRLRAFVRYLGSNMCKRSEPQ